MDSWARGVYADAVKDKPPILDVPLDEDNHFSIEWHRGGLRLSSTVDGVELDEHTFRTTHGITQDGKLRLVARDGLDGPVVGIQTLHDDPKNNYWEFDFDRIAPELPDRFREQYPTPQDLAEDPGLVWDPDSHPEQPPLRIGGLVYFTIGGVLYVFDPQNGEFKPIALVGSSNAHPNAARMVAREGGDRATTNGPADGERGDEGDDDEQLKEYQALLRTPRAEEVFTDDVRATLADLDPGTLIIVTQQHELDEQNEYDLLAYPAPGPALDLVRSIVGDRHVGSVHALDLVLGLETDDPLDPPEPSQDELPPALTGGDPDDWGTYLGEGGSHIAYRDRTGNWVYVVVKSIDPVTGRWLTLAEQRERAELLVAGVRAVRRDPSLRPVIPNVRIVAPGVIRRPFFGSADDRGRRRRDAKELEDRYDPLELLALLNPFEMRAESMLRALGPEPEDVDWAVIVDTPDFSYSDIRFVWDDATQAPTDPLWVDPIAVTVPPPGDQLATSLRYVPTTIEESGGVEGVPIFSLAESRRLHGFPRPVGRSHHDQSNSVNTQEATRHIVREMYEDPEYDRRLTPGWPFESQTEVDGLLDLAAGIFAMGGNRTPGGRPRADETIRWFREWIDTAEGGGQVATATSTRISNLAEEDWRAFQDFTEVLLASTGSHDDAAADQLLMRAERSLLENNGPEVAGTALGFGVLLERITKASSTMRDPPHVAFLRVLGEEEELRRDGELNERILGTKHLYLRDVVFAEEHGNQRFGRGAPQPAARQRIAEELGIEEHFFSLTLDEILALSSDETQARFAVNMRMHEIVADVMESDSSLNDDQIWRQTRERLMGEFPEYKGLPKDLFSDPG